MVTSILVISATLKSSRLFPAVSTAVFDIVQAIMLPGVQGRLKTSLLALKMIGEAIGGAPLAALNITEDDFLTLDTPFIAFIDGGDYVTVQEVTRSRVTFVNNGIVTYVNTLDEFMTRWDGVVLTQEQATGLTELTIDEMRSILGAEIVWDQVDVYGRPIHGTYDDGTEVTLEYLTDDEYFSAQLVLLVSFIVKLTPSTQIDPFLAIYFFL